MRARINVTSWRKRAVTLIATGAIALSSGAVATGMFPAAAYADTGTVTITQKANPNATYDVYKLFTAVIDGQNNATNVEWAIDDTHVTALVTQLNNSDYDTWLTTNGHTDADDAKNPQNALEFITEQINASQSYDNHDPKWVTGDSFAMGFAQWVSQNITPETTGATAGTPYSNDEGYYLFLTSDSSLSDDDVATAPIWFPLGGSATTIDEKAKPATIQKEVQEDSTDVWGKLADAEIGQEVPYRITVTVPGNYKSFTSFYAQVHDTLPEGMTLDTESVRVYVDNGDGHPQDVTSNFTIKFDNHVLTVTNGNTMDDSTNTYLNASSKLRVEYTAKLSSLAGGDIIYGGEGNENDAKFIFSNKPGSNTRGETNKDKAKLYVYRMNVDKFDQATQEALAGAKFVIMNSEGKYLANAGDEHAPNWGWTADSQDTAYKFETDESGTINDIVGLDEGTYTLIEVEAPEHYVTPSGDAAKVTIKVTSSFDANGLKTLTATVTGGMGKLDSDTTSGATGTVGVDVENSKNVLLAMTGAEGVGIGGAAVVAIGLGWWLIRRHRANAEQNA